LSNDIVDIHSSSSIPQRRAFASLRRVAVLGTRRPVS
jgi:hypothetical protein